MKKVLLGTTALVAGALLANPVLASDKIKLSVGGYSKWWVVGQWNSSDYEKGNVVGRDSRSYNNVDVKGDNLITFSGETTLDNGMKVGVSVAMMAGGHTDATTDTIDKSYVYVEGGFGKFIVGTNANGTALLQVAAPDAAGNAGNTGIMTGDYAIARPASVNGLAGGNTTSIATDNNAKKITYVAPTFAHITAGASYVPSGAVSSRGLTNLNNTGTVGAGSYPQPIQEIYGAGALYDNTVGGVGIKLSAGAITAKLESGYSNSWFEQSYGGQLSYAGFTLGGSWRQQRGNYTNGGADMGGAGGTISFNGGSFGNGSGMDVGLQYETGPYAVSFYYFHSGVQHNSLGSTNNGDDKIDFYQVSGKYALGPGVDVLASAGYAKYDSVLASTATATTGDDNHNSGWTVMSGLSLTF